MRHGMGRAWGWGTALTLLLAGCGGFAPSTSTDPDALVTGQREIISRVTGDAPNFAQMSNGTMLSVVSRDFGRGAKAGALIELFYPHFATDHLWDSYVGIRNGQAFKWAHQLRLVRQAMVPDTGVIVSVFEGEGYTLTLEDVMRPQANAQLRRVSVTNTSGQPLTDLEARFYAFFTLNHLPGGDRLRYDAASNALVQSDKGVAVALQADRKPAGWQVGHANLPLGSAQDARLDAEDGALKGNPEAGPTVAGVNGALALKIAALAPGERQQLTFAIGISEDERGALAETRKALELGWEGVRQEDAGTWQAWLNSSKQPAMPETARAVYRRALIGLKQHTARNGAIIAAPTNLNPPYRFVWPRDGSIIALTLLEAGHAAEAKTFFSFLERTQQKSGGWAINYFPDASRPLWDFGKNGNEHDQVGTFVWGVERVYRETGDRGWLAARWPAVSKACDFLLDVQDAGGLLTKCRDLWELDHDGTWTYSNAAGWAGLNAGAEIAQRLGRPQDAARYRAAADRLHQAMGKELIVNGYFSRGKRKGRLDPTIEAANLALGAQAFGVFPDSDPRMRATGEAVARALTSSGGGIRRYQGDQYYDGQPWPVATTWLALHRLELGDRSSAMALFDVMTRYAHQTESLMLGEQFDEGQKRWVSAFPLAWSEASYVRSALKLF